MHAYLRSLALGLALLLPAVPAFAADAPAKTDVLHLKHLQAA